MKEKIRRPTDGQMRTEREERKARLNTKVGGVGLGGGGGAVREVRQSV